MKLDKHLKPQDLWQHHQSNHIHCPAPAFKLANINTTYLSRGNEKLKTMEVPYKSKILNTHTNMHRCIHSHSKREWEGMGQLFYCLTVSKSGRKFSMRALSTLLRYKWNRNASLRSQNTTRVPRSYLNRKKLRLMIILLL